MYGDLDFYNEPSEFEQEIDSFKESLRKAVKEEITEEITKLRATVKEQAGKLANLTALEEAAKRARQDYEHKATQAKQEAKREVQKEGIQKLLEVLAEPRYRIAVNYQQPPKCDKCDTDRRIPYTTPLGRKQSEHCDCATSEVVYVVEEQMAQEVSKRRGEVVVWYQNSDRFSDRDSFGSPTVLKNAEAVPIDELLKAPRDYGFRSEEDAQLVADRLNENKESKEESNGPW